MSNQASRSAATTCKLRQPEKLYRGNLSPAAFRTPIERFDQRGRNQRVFGMFAIVSHARFDFVSISGQSPMSQKTRFPPPRRPAPDGSVEAGWWHRTDDDRIVCDLCPRECHLKPGDRGFCFVRENRDGEMRLTTYGRSTGFCIDPIEKKPLNHFSLERVYFRSGLPAAILAANSAKTGRSRSHGKFAN